MSSRIKKKSYPPRLIDIHAIADQAMINYGFIPHFPSGVIEEVKSLNESQRKRRLDPSVRDLRSLLWSSIDNLESRDLDQLEVCESKTNQEIRVLVAIADVDEYVMQDSWTDRHAFHNGTSVYTGAVTYPMLPERLSTDLSSLNPNEDRSAIILDFIVGKDGRVLNGDVYRALVRNKAKLVYESVGDWLENKTPLPEAVAQVNGLKEQIILQNEAAERLRRFRMEQGSMEFDTIEASPVMAEGKVVDLIVKRKNQARYLIENFMVAANGVMVQFLEKKGVPYIQRVVRTPERWDRIAAIAASLEETLPVEPDPRALSAFLSKRNRIDPDHFADLSLVIVKLLGPGEYVLAEGPKTKLGHFGLSVRDYTHSTAPNRRYPDLVIQRLLKAQSSGSKNPYTVQQLSDLAQVCTEREKAAKKVERFMRKVAGAVLLIDRIGEIFDAIVTGASAKGTYVRLLSPPVEGRVLQGEQGMDVGEKVRVRLIGMEPEKGYINFAGVGSR